MSTTKKPSAPRRLTRTAGEILITVGVVLLLFVGWQLWWTDVLAGQAHANTRSALQTEWSLSSTDEAVDTDIKTTYGKPFGLLYVPQLRDRAWGVPIIQGTEHYLLNNGVGHHVNSALPGQVGNFAIAGHRTTYGAPFAEIQTLKPGDQVIVETKKGWFIYELDRDVIIDYWEGWVLDPVPGKPRSTKPEEKLITMYACHPKYSSAQRYVWFGTLVDEYPKSQDTPPAIEKYGKA